MERHFLGWQYGCIASVTLALFFIPLLGKAQSGLYYRSIASGNWSDITSWQTSTTAAFSTPLAATVAPNQTANTITIRNGHTISIIANVTIDEVIVDLGGDLVLSNTASLTVTVNNGTGADIQVNGTLEDRLLGNVSWGVFSTWSAGTQSTFIKTGGGIATTWQTNYENGAINIPSTHTWIYRKQTTDNPAVTIAGAYYGNLSFDNTTGTLWDATSVGSKLAGSALTGIITGKFTVGDNCKIYLENSAAALLFIQGDFEIQPLGTLVLNSSGLGGARGLDIQGNMTINGSLSYSTTGAGSLNRIIQFSGTGNQTISSASSLNIYNLVINKLGGKVTMMNDVTVANTITFTVGLLDLNKHILTLTNGNAAALICVLGGMYAEDVLFQGQFKRTISQPLSLYVFPFVTASTSVALTLLSAATVNNEVVSVSTYPTANDNLPLAHFNSLQVDLPNGAVTDNLNFIADRYWWVDAPASLSVVNLSMTFAPTDFNSLVTAWDIIYNTTGTSWSRINTNEPSLILTSLPATNIQGIWSAIKHNVSLGFTSSPPIITTEKSPNEIVDIDIYTIDGKWLKTIKATTVITEKSNLTSGLYLLRVIHENYAETLKIGVQ